MELISIELVEATELVEAAEPPISSIDVESDSTESTTATGHQFLQQSLIQYLQFLQFSHLSD